MMPALALVIFAAMFLVVFVLRSVIQKRRTGDTGIRAGVLDAPVGSLEWIAGLMLVVAILTAVGAPVAELAGLEPWTESNWFRGIGALIALAGTTLTFLSQLSMGDSWRIGIDPNERTHLVTNGAFRIVRNPIFSAVIVVAVGLAMMVPNPISATGIALVISAIELQVRAVEEPHLRELHGQQYKDYEAQVGRFLPKLNGR